MNKELKTEIDKKSSIIVDDESKSMLTYLLVELYQDNKFRIQSASKSVNLGIDSQERTIKVRGIHPDHKMNTSVSAYPHKRKTSDDDVNINLIHSQSI